VFGWTTDVAEQAATPHYPATPPQHAQLARALFELRTSDDACRRYLADPAGFAQAHALTPEQTEPFAAMDEDRLRESFHLHPLLTSGAVRRLALVTKSAITTAG
jgi:hypothetical protein